MSGGEEIYKSSLSHAADVITKKKSFFYNSSFKSFGEYKGVMSNNNLLVQLRKSDSFYDFQKWPLHIKKKFLTRHKGYADRFVVWHFLWSNGMDPYDAVYWTLWHGGYDQNAHNSMRRTALKASTKPEEFKTYKYYDMIERRPMGGHRESPKWY